MSNRVNPDSWRRIGAVLDRLSDVDLRLDPEAVAEACQAEGISPEEIQPFLDGARRAVTLPEELDPAVLDAAVRALAVESTGRSLVEGERLGPYEVVARLGGGGMGDVYEARDTRLGRPVALKLVRADLAARPDGRLRFEREARAISTLNHPHICTLHDVGEHDGVGYLVMELVEGETLDVRLERRTLPLQDALEYGAQIAEALAAAQRVGIIHRDLKPANIMITPHGGVKVLDFGLATLRPERGPVPDATNHRLTAEGTILGTLQYMAPEQLQGKEVDARADIFSLGAILYEMVSGRKAFDADSSAGLVAAVLEREPAPIGTVRHDAPVSLDWVIGQCLAKDPGRRWEHAGDLARQLRWLSESRPPATGRLNRFRQRRVIVRAVAALLVLVAGAGAVAYLTRSRERQFSNVGLLRFAIPPPDGTRFEQLFSLSPDGGRLAFTAIDERGVPALWIRPLDALNAQRIGGTDGAFFPFWSPDGRSLGFFANSALKRVDLETGNVRTICPAGFGGGGSWNRDDVIVFAANSGASSTPQQQVLLRVSASGGTPRPVTRVKGGFGNHAWPHFLPDGRHYLYMRSEAGEWAGVHLGRLDSEWEKPIHVVQKMAEVSGETDVARLALENATNSGRRATAGGPNTRAVYAAGHLFFLRDRALVGQPFDISRLELTGEPVRIADAVALDAPGRSAFDVSPNGILAYRAPATPAASELTWFDRTGRTLGRVGDVGAYRFAALSPDGRSVLATRRESGLQTGGIVRIEIASGTEVAVGQRGSFPIWSPDGTRFVYRSAGFPVAYVAPTDGSNRVGEPLSSLTYAFPHDWSADGRTVLGTVYRAETSSYDIWSTLVGTGAVSFVLQSSSAELDPQLSRDQRWLAYASNESGRFEVYVRPFVGAGPVTRISRNGGRKPRWSDDGREIFYVQGDGSLMQAALNPGVPQVQALRLLFRHQSLSYTDETGSPAQREDAPEYSVAPDGKRLLIGVPVESPTHSPITVVSNWPALVKR